MVAKNMQWGDASQDYLVHHFFCFQSGFDKLLLFICCLEWAGYMRLEMSRRTWVCTYGFQRQVSLLSFICVSCSFSSINYYSIPSNRSSYISA